ncbi:SPFH domain-containing protein [Clostridium bovifaecis]|uniref:SPFH domain-containing protein n=1 Tax=Clostridium bovifaecis TaxID=2184719 RepID=A0A6I6F168_9CLOT|nr:SPFH domain-containing protein [Clostridium bovifaecis]
MSKIDSTKEKQIHCSEIELKAKNGMGILLLNILLMILAIVGFIFGVIFANKGASLALGVILIIIGAVYLFIIGPILFAGLKVLKPNEALVLTLFGKYYGTLKGEGFFFVNPFVTAVNPATSTPTTASVSIEHSTAAGKNTVQAGNLGSMSKKISLKAMTLNNDKQKINDQLGNPIVIGIVVIWKVVNTAKAVFNVDNYTEYLSIQCDSALRNIVRLYPYDVSSDDNEKSLRGSSQEVAERIKAEIQSKVEIAGLEILEARITHLAYAPEVAAVMLQRQQASAIIDARQMIVEGAVGMVEMALAKLNENDIVHLDEERKAAMVSNLLVVLCGNKDAQPIVNSGSLY